MTINVVPTSTAVEVVRLIQEDAAGEGVISLTTEDASITVAMSGTGVRVDGTGSLR